MPRGHPKHSRKAAKFEKPRKRTPSTTGRQQHFPTPETRAAVAAGAATFLSHDLIALQLGISKPTLERNYRIELDTAVERANATVVSRLHGHTTKHPVACFFWLQNRDSDRWKHANVLRHQHDAGGKLASLADLVLQSYQQPAAGQRARFPRSRPRRGALAGRLWRRRGWRLVARRC